jgi:hypothetical protein
MNLIIVDAVNASLLKLLPVDIVFHRCFLCIDYFIAPLIFVFMVLCGRYPLAHCV